MEASTVDTLPHRHLTDGETKRWVNDGDRKRVMGLKNLKKNKKNNNNNKKTQQQQQQKTQKNKQTKKQQQQPKTTEAFEIAQNSV